MKSRVLMIQGTMSSVGKSLMVAALCRIFKQDGLRVAPFKAQNMALNSYATRDGLEVGRAQAMQADAAGVDVTVEMNPVLIKPEADAFAQIVVMGKPWARLPAGEYMSRRTELWSIVTRALDSLRDEYDLVVIEGAGSPAELNLRRGDLVNMAIAEYADAPVLLVGDIDRGGIFAQLIGTRMLLEASERARIKGYIVNKFRGDARLFDDGVKILEERGGAPVLGVVPFIRDLRIADEDAVALDDLPRVGARHSPDRDSIGSQPGSSRRAENSHHALANASPLQIVVIRFPHISNFDDFDPLRAETDVAVRFVDRAEEIGAPDLIILPGTKTTVADLGWLRSRGIADRIVQLARTETPILGICGGYQMLGRAICDPLGVESDATQVEGLGLLPVVTTFEAEKQTVRATARVIATQGLFAQAGGVEIQGYEIHMGRTRVVVGARHSPNQESMGNPPGSCQAATHSRHALANASPLQVISRGDLIADDFDGAVSADGWVTGTYFHGLFDNDALRNVILQNLSARKGATWPHRAVFDREKMYDRLAEVVRANVDVKKIYELLG